MTAPPIEFDTDRLSFRVWRDDHRAPFARMNSDPEVMRFFPAMPTPQQSDASIDTWLAQFDAQGWSNWAVELRATGDFIGFIGLSVPRRAFAFTPCVEVGWRLRRSAWGQGFATEGARACLRQGFERVGLEEIVSFAAVANLPSIAVMERIGMRNANSDFLHPAIPQGAPLQLHCLYKMTRAEWLAQHGSQEENG